MKAGEKATLAGPRARRRAAAVVVTLAVALPSAGCDTWETAGGRTPAGQRPDADDRSRASGPPACVHGPTRPARLQERVGLRPGGRGYAPGAVVDAALAADGSVFVLDPETPRVWHLTADLEPTGSWGRGGAGPGELRDPRALSVDPVDGTVVVASGSPPALARFTAEGRLVRRAPLPATPERITIATTGDLIVTLAPLQAHDAVGPPGAPHHASDVATVLRVDRAFRDVDTLRVRLGPSGRARPLAELERTSPGVAWPFAAGGRVAVVFPFSGGAVALGPDGARHLPGCLPRTLLRGNPRVADPGRRSITSVVLASAALPLGDGGVLVFSARPSREGRIHLSLRRPDGTVQSLAAPLGPMRLPPFARFEDDKTLLVFGHSGRIAKVRVVSRARLDAPWS